MLLSVNDLHVYYGAIHAVKGVSLEVNEGEIVTLIGANGAGKSTVLNTISGLLHAKPARSNLWVRRSTPWPPTRLFSLVSRSARKDAACSRI